jgi:mono/diheme cytochrome c family protein
MSLSLSPFHFVLACLVLLTAQTSLASAQDSVQVAKGKEYYTQSCQQCHGADGKRGEGFQTPIWGDGSLIATKFGNAGALIDYMQIMPFNDPALLDEAQKIAVVAYMLANHGAMPRNAELTRQDAASIPIK